MSKRAEPSELIPRLKCWLLYHDMDLVSDEVLDGGDYVEVRWRCARCGETDEQIREYNEAEY